MEFGRVLLCRLRFDALSQVGRLADGDSVRPRWWPKLRKKPHANSTCDAPRGWPTDAPYFGVEAAGDVSVYLRWKQTAE